MKAIVVGISKPSLKSTSPQSHEYWEIILNLEGEGTTVVNGIEYHFCPGTIICVPPDAIHIKTSQCGFRDIFILASDFISPANEGVTIINDDEEKSFEALMFLALRIFHKKVISYAPILNSLYETIQQMLLCWSGTKPKNEFIESFKNELINNFSNPEFKIFDALKNTCYCNDYFRRCFKNDTGTTPVSYFINLKIQYAKKLLLQNNYAKMTILEISFLCGFYDPRYFSRIFKKKVGLTPQEYIIQNRQKNDF